MATDTPAHQLSLPRQLARTQRFSLGVPGRFALTADGSTALFLRSRGGADPVDCLWARDVATGAERLLADPAVLAPEQAGRGSGIGAYATDASGRRVAFAFAGRIWTLEPDSTEPARPLHLAAAPPAAPPVEPRPDPTGRRIAYRSGPSLRVVEWDGTGDRAVAAPEPGERGGEFGDDVSFGAPEYVATASMHRNRGYWWSPDGERLLVARVDVSGVQGRWIADPADPTVRPRAARYPAVGTSRSGSPSRASWYWRSTGAACRDGARAGSARSTSTSSARRSRTRSTRSTRSRPSTRSSGWTWTASPSAAGPSAARWPRRRCCGDVFHAAAAGAGVTDQHLYDTHWRERFLGHPDAEPAAYEACDLLRDAPTLRRPLLLMHGLVDDNVYPANTLRLSAALLAAGRPHEFLPLTGSGHRVTDEALAEGMLLHQLDFLRRALGLTPRDAQ